MFLVSYTRLIAGGNICSKFLVSPYVPNNIGMFLLLPPIFSAKEEKNVRLNQDC